MSDTPVTKLSEKELFVLFVNILHDHGDTYAGKWTARWQDCPQRYAHEGTADRLVAALGVGDD